MVPALEPAGARAELQAMLGATRAAALRRALIARTAQWAAEVAPGRVHVAYGAPETESSLTTLLGAGGAQLFLQSGADPSRRLAHATHQVFAAAEGAVLIVWPSLPCWRPEHAAAALGDLAAGADVALGPVFDGGFYLVALRRPIPAVLALPEATWTSPDAMGTALDVIQASGLDLGLLGAERGLRRASDVRAALADPLLDAELRTILGGA